MAIGDTDAIGNVDKSAIAGEQSNSGIVGAAGGSDNPAGSGDGFTVINPAEIGNSDSGNIGTEQPRRRRGRPPGSGRKPNTTKTGKATYINGLENILYSMHNMLASVVQIPEIALDEKEATQLADGINKVAAHYDMSATQKQVDWANLIMLCGAIYGTRFFAYRMRRSTEPKQEEILVRPPPVSPNAQPRPNGAAASRRVNIPGVGAVEVPNQ